MLPDDRASYIAVERRFDVTIDITKEWFQSYVDELAKYADTKENISCDVRLGSDFDNRMTFRNRKALINFVFENWNDVVETSIWQYGGVIKHALCNHRRHHVLLNVESANTSDIEKTFGHLCQVLSLVLSPIDPYRYRRSSLEFEIGNWRPDSFAEGIKAIAGFLGPDPDISEAYAKSFDGDIEKLTPFFDLRSFCMSIGTRASRFTELGIRMQARSIGVGIGVTSDHKKLRIRTTLPTDEVDKLITVWPDELKIKAIKAADTGADMSDVAPKASENPWLKYGIPVVIAFITAMSVTSAVSLKKAVWPDYKINITNPHIENGIAKWSGDVVPIEWYLQPEQSSFRGMQKDVAATVKINTPSLSLPPMESKSPMSVPLKPGSYFVVIDAPGAAPLQFQLIVEDHNFQSIKDHHKE